MYKGKSMELLFVETIARGGTLQFSKGLYRGHKNISHIKQRVVRCVTFRG
jgi:hypothetical protein